METGLHQDGNAGRFSSHLLARKSKTVLFITVAETGQSNPTSALVLELPTHAYM